jgi:hypothetical protein
MTSSLVSELLQRAEYDFLTSTMNFEANLHNNRVLAKDHKPYPNLTEIGLAPKKMICE